MSFYVGLSLLSNIRPGSSTGTAAELHAEGRRLLASVNGDKPLSQAPADADEGILITEAGRPYYADGHADFSISHSGRMAAAAWSDGGRVGCDIQKIDLARDHAAVAKRFFHTEEIDWIARVPAPEDRAYRFYQLWTLKESWIKLHGLSVFEIGGTPVFTPPFGAAEHFHMWELTTPGEGDGERYLLCTAAERPVSPPRIRWLSGARMAARTCVFRS